MSRPLSDVFSYYGRRPNQFFLAELEDMLCPPADEKSGKRSITPAVGTKHDVEGAEGAKAKYSLSLNAEKTELTLSIHIMQGDHTYDSHLTATKVRDDNLFEIKALTFDNKPEKLKNRWEITSVLGFLGKNHISGIAENKIPEPHRERGQFGKVGRFFNRMLADNPHTMMYYPPYF